MASEKNSHTPTYHDILAHKLLNLMKKEGNNKCADCNQINPKWTSWNLGIFICMNCAGIHRKLGVGISKVKSISLDNWNDIAYSNMENIGNIKSNSYYEGNLPSSFHRPNSSSIQMETFITNKYVKKLYISSNSDDYPLHSSFKVSCHDNLNKNNKSEGNVNELTKNISINHYNDLIGLFDNFNPSIILNNENFSNENNDQDLSPIVVSTSSNNCSHSVNEIMKIFDTYNSNDYTNDNNNYISTLPYGSISSDNINHHQTINNTNSNQNEERDDPFDHIFK